MQGRNKNAKKINHYTYNSWNYQNAWALGLLVANGSFGTVSRPQEFKVYNTDLEMLEGFKDVFESDKKVFVNQGVKGRYGKKPVGAIILSSPIMIPFFKEINAHGQADKRNPFKNIPEKYKWAYIKGVFDGDGNFSKRKHFSIAGMKEHMQEIYNWICGELEKEPNKLHASTSNKTTFYFTFGKKDSYFIYKKMEENSPDTYKSVKYNRWEKTYL